MSARGALERLLPRIAVRSFFLQAGWNFERLQHLGFAFAVEPALRRLYPNEEERRKAMLRYFEFFNTHPYLASLVMGSTLRLEEECLRRGEDPAEKVSALKMALLGPLAAMGDALFWATLRPLAALLGVALAWMVPPSAWHWSAPLLLFLGFFNLPHLVLRFQGLFRGYALGTRIADYVRETDVQGAIAGLRRGGLVVLGAVLAGFGLFRHLASGERMPFFGNFLFLGGGLVMLLALRLRVRPTMVLCAVFLFQLVLSFAFAGNAGGRP